MVRFQEEKKTQLISFLKIIIIIITIAMVNSLSSGCVSGDRSEQSGLRHMEGGKESDRAAAPPGPCRACWAGESAKGSKQCQNTSRSSV